jgi:plasmid stabilization system protein ParE
VSGYRLSRQARIDLDGIAEYIAEHNPAAVDRVLAGLRDTFSMLAASPQIGELRDDLSPGVRMQLAKRPAHKYVIFYYDRGDGVEISDVIHGARDWPGMFARGQRGH